MALKVENFPSTDICLGYQLNLTLSASTSLSAPVTAKWMLITVENGAMRYRCDCDNNSIAPTVSQGMLMQAGESRAIGLANFARFRAIQVGSGATMSVEYWGVHG